MKRAIIPSKEIKCIRARKIEMKTAKELYCACTSQSKLRVTGYIELYILQRKIRLR